MKTALSKIIIMCLTVLTTFVAGTRLATAQVFYCSACNSGSQCGQPCIDAHSSSGVSSCGAQGQCDFNNCGVQTNLVFDRSFVFSGNTYNDGGQQYCIMDRLRLAVEWDSCSQSSTGCSAWWSFGESWAYNGDCNDIAWTDENQGTYDTYCN
jgi:hypothetical protein